MHQKLSYTIEADVILDAYNPRNLRSYRLRRRDSPDRRETMASFENNESIICGFCSQQDFAIEEPVTLPCDHVHCQRCLRTVYDSINFVKCPVCSNEYEINKVCPYRGTRCTALCSSSKCEKPASINCRDCPDKNNWCENHEEKHCQMDPEHKPMTIEEYRKVYKKLKIRMCDCGAQKESVHKACLCCLSLSCVDCFQQKSIVGGKTHNFIHLDEVVKKLAKDIKDLSDKLNTKQEQLSALFKQTENFIKDYDEQTKCLEDMIENAKQTQMAAIDKAYDGLKTDLIERRQKTRKDLEAFSLDTVRQKRFQLKVAELKMQSHLTYKHQADVVSDHTHIQHQIQQLIDEALPSCTLNITELVPQDVNIKTELNFCVKKKDLCLESPLSLSDSSDDDKYEDADDSSDVGENILVLPNQDDLYYS